MWLTSEFVVDRRGLEPRTLALGHHPVNLCTLLQQAPQKMFQPGKNYRKSPGYRKITQRYVLTSPSKGLEFDAEKNATTQNVRRC